jgi:hypothetical protein
MDLWPYAISPSFCTEGTVPFVIVAPRTPDGESSVSERHGAAMHGGADWENRG